MFITKKGLDRRTVLRGMGAGLALPLLDAMVPALTPVALSAANPTRRLGIVYVPLGWRPGFWVPPTTGTNFEYTPILKPLEGLREHVTIVTQLDNPLDGHATTVSAWLSGSIPKKTFAEDVYSGETVDQAVAKKIGQETALPNSILDRCTTILEKDLIAKTNANPPSLAAAGVLNRYDSPSVFT